MSSPPANASTPAGQESEPSPDPPSLDVPVGIPTLQSVLNQGNELLKKQQAEFQERWERALTDITGRGEITVDMPGFDEDIKQFFNAHSGSPLTQMVFLLVQLTRSQIKTQLLVQAMAAHMAGIEDTDTQKAAEEIISGDKKS